MAFTVDPAALAGLPRLLDRLGADADAGRAYLSRHATLDGGEGVFNDLLGTHRAAIGAVDRFFARAAGPVAGGQAAAVRAAISAYRRTDLAASAALDATMPGTAGVPWRRAEGRSDAMFGDLTEPQSALTPPGGLGTPGLSPTIGHLFSVANTGRGAILMVTAVAARLGLCPGAVDIYLECVRPLIGDWDGLYRCGDALGHLGRAAAMMGANVDGAAVDTQRVWTGNAADGCRDFLVRTGRALDGAAGPLRRLADEYHDVARRTLEIAAEIADLLAIATDLAILTAVEIELAQATAPTLIGPLAFGTAATGSIVQIVSRVHRALAAVESIVVLVRLFRATLAGFNLIDGDHPLPALPLRALPLPAPPSHAFS